MIFNQFPYFPILFLLKILQQNLNKNQKNTKIFKKNEQKILAHTFYHQSKTVNGQKLASIKKYT